MDLQIETLVCGAYEENCYIVSVSGREDCVVIDPGDDGDQIGRALRGRTPAAILLTHGHFDHMLGAQTMRGVPVYVGAGDMDMVRDEKLSLYDAKVSGMPFAPLTEAQPYESEISLCGMTFQVCPSPGHTPGGVCLYEKERGVIFTGDTLFMGGYGRTDFPGGSFSQLRQSLRFLLALPKETIFYPGHGAGGRMGENR